MRGYGAAGSNCRAVQSTTTSVPLSWTVQCHQVRPTWPQDKRVPSLPFFPERRQKPHRGLLTPTADVLVWVPELPAERAAGEELDGGLGRRFEVGEVDRSVEAVSEHGRQAARHRNLQFELDARGLSPSLTQRSLWQHPHRHVDRKHDRAVRQVLADTRYLAAGEEPLVREAAASCLEPWRAYIAARFVDDPHLPAVSLLDELTAAGFDRSYPTLVRELRRTALRPVWADSIGRRNA
jgi:hypothetical protein